MADGTRQGGTARPLTQARLDALLGQTFSVPVRLDTTAPPDLTVTPYQSLAQRLPGWTFSFAPRTLLHAIGTKTVPVSIGRDEAIRSAHRYAYVLDLDSGQLQFRASVDPDNRTNESREVGIGITCLIASRVWHIPWDQLEPIRGAGMRCDFRGEVGPLTAILEAKGSTSVGTQNSQLDHSAKKKAAHRARGENHDIELTVATRIAVPGSTPDIVLADPPFEVPEETFGPRGRKVYRYRHWCRIMRFVGMPELAHSFYLTSNKVARGEDIPLVPPPVRAPRPPDMLEADGARYIGRWSRNWVPDDGRYRRRVAAARAEGEASPYEGQVETFQGIREDILHDLEHVGPERIGADGGAHPEDWEASNGVPVSVFADGTAFAARVVG